MSEFLETARHIGEIYLLPIGLRLLLALVVFFFGRSLARGIVRTLDRMMERSKFDASLRKFLHDIAYAVLLVAVAIMALDMMGVETTAVIAVLGAAGLAVGLALQGSLSNFAAGVMLIILRPYKVTDLVVLGKYLGRIEAIKIFHTTLITNDNREITIPNGQILANPIENLTALGRRRIDFVVNVTDVKDLADTKKLLEEAVQADDRVLVAPAPSVEVAEVTDRTVRLLLRPWTSVEAYNAVVASTMERLKERLGGAGQKFSVTLASVA